MTDQASDRDATSDALLRELGTQLPYDRPDHDRREAVRSSLLVAATTERAPAPDRRWLLVGGGFVAGALAAAAAVLVIARPATPAPTTLASASSGAAEAQPYAQVESSSLAELERTRTPTESGGIDERVRVHGGTVRLAIPPTRRGDRVRVTTGDAEVEGTGTYEIVVAHETLASVTVLAGTAAVKLAGQSQPVFLSAGGSWRAPIARADLAGPNAPAPTPAATEVALAPTPGVVPSVAPVPATAQVAPAPVIARAPLTRPTSALPSRLAVTTPPAETAKPDVADAPALPPASEAGSGSDGAVARATTTEQHFQAGLARLRSGALADAIVELGAAAEAGDGALAADARYYQAVALIRARRGAEAERALVRFLDQAPTSTRRGRAAMMLGKLIVDRGDASSARPWFELAGRDADPAVAAAARAALGPR